ncbi:hypothetical protein [Caldimonas caldifontis]|uniref:hypothetical protein n=1 Tax=Caldimonas caldifontis TaxID=1452508 RepID=UPI001FEB3FC3|nr:hypothetical protein [Caldimonas caldifontis]
MDRLNGLSGCVANDREALGNLAGRSAHLGHGTQPVGHLSSQKGGLQAVARRSIRLASDECQIGARARKDAPATPKLGRLGLKRFEGKQRRGA